MGDRQDDRRRSRRMGSLLREELSEMIGRELRDPRIAGVVVTEVAASDDLRHARVYISLPGASDDAIDEALEGLSRAEGFIRGKLSKKLRIRKAPDIRFYRDGSFKQGAHIEDLLASVKTESEDG